MKNVLIASFDMEVGGVERSLINMLQSFDYNNYNVDLMLYRHKGNFMKLLKGKFNILDEIEEYTAFRKSILEIFKDKKINLAVARIKARMDASRYAKTNGLEEAGYVQMQRMWQYSLKYLPCLDKEYDVAISYLWPHYFVANKVKAKKKIAWIHTDYSCIDTDITEDIEVWNKFDSIVAVSEECKNSFLKKYNILSKKVVVMENIVSPELIRFMAEEEVEDDISKEKGFKLLSVARLSMAKGIDNGVRALRILHDKGLTDIKWYVVGYGGDEGMIRKLIKENHLEKDFIILGKKINPYPYMKSCDLYVQPSRYEGRAVTVTEAQILGKAVIITNYPTSKSQLRDGVDGLICDQSVQGIADGIENIYKNIYFKNEMEDYCRKGNYNNVGEVVKVYKLF
jgi:glycosyltransferase involved in cell wall biosynthesis